MNPMFWLFKKISSLNISISINLQILFSRYITSQLFTKLLSNTWLSTKGYSL